MMQINSFTESILNKIGPIDQIINKSGNKTIQICGNYSSISDKEVPVLTFDYEPQETHVKCTAFVFGNKLISFDLMDINQAVKEIKNLLSKDDGLIIDFWYNMQIIPFSKLLSEQFYVTKKIFKNDKEIWATSVLTTPTDKVIQFETPKILINEKNDLEYLMGLTLRNYYAQFILFKLTENNYRLYFDGKLLLTGPLDTINKKFYNHLIYGN